jgi:hypothetical protein
MTRIPLDDLTSDQLDLLYDRIDQLREDYADARESEADAIQRAAASADRAVNVCCAHDRLRQQAEEQRDQAAAAVLRIVADWHTEASGGDADEDDLAWRLARAGYPLPEDGETAPVQPPTGTARPTRYEICALPDGDFNRKFFTLFVEHMGDDRWAVHDGYACYDTYGNASEGIRPYGRGDTWLAVYRFDRETALRLAEQLAPDVTVNGITAAQALRAAAQPPTGATGDAQ